MQLHLDAYCPMRGQPADHLQRSIEGGAFPQDQALPSILGRPAGAEQGERRAVPAQATDDRPPPRSRGGPRPRPVQ